jgi:CubicO group peptidase (beta-lactamase class C family)
LRKAPAHRYTRFARETLFDPLGIGPTEWLTDRRGEAIAASGLRMTPCDLASIGSMMLKGGMWGERRVVQAQWLERSMSSFVDVDEFLSYGYLWYLGKFTLTVSTVPRWDQSRLERFWSAIGNGGRLLFVFPGLDLAVAITAGNYDTPDRWFPPTRLCLRLCCPAFCKRSGARETAFVKYILPDNFPIAIVSHVARLGRRNRPRRSGLRLDGGANIPRPGANNETGLAEETWSR